jgi:hypothetical protein
VAARLGLLHYGGRHVQRLYEIFEVRALAADVETQSLDGQSGVKCLCDEIHRFAGITAELR